MILRPARRTLRQKAIFAAFGVWALIGGLIARALVGLLIKAFRFSAAATGQLCVKWILPDWTNGLTTSASASKPFESRLRLMPLRLQNHTKSADLHHTDPGPVPHQSGMPMALTRIDPTALRTN
jgi:hypothetical protein